MAEIPIAVNDRFRSLTATGGQTVFAGDFPILDKSEVTVTRVVAGVRTLLVLDTHYSVSGVGQASGFTVTLTSGATAGHVYEIAGATKFERLSDYGFGAALPTPDLNADLDRAVMRDQELNRDILRVATDFSGIAKNRGDLLMKGASVMGALAAGAAGLFLMSNGPGADLSYEVVPPNTVIVSEAGASLLANFLTPQMFQGEAGTDVTSAVETMVAISGSKAQYFFPPGDYYLSDTIDLLNRNVEIVGGGRGVTRIICTHAGEVFDFLDETNSNSQLAVKRFNIRDLTIVKGVDTTSGNGQTAIRARWSYTGVVSSLDQFSAYNVAILGDGLNRFWNEGIRLIDCGCSNFFGVRIDNDCGSDHAYSGIVFQRDAASNITSIGISGWQIHHFQNGVTFEHKNAAQAGTIEGVYMSLGETFGCRRAIYDDNESGTDTSKIINGLTYIGAHAGCSRAFIRAGWISNLYIVGNNFTMSVTGGDSASGGEPWIKVTSDLQVCQIANNRFFRSTSGTTIAKCIEVPGNDHTIGLQIVGNSFENWSTPCVDIDGGTMGRTMARAWIGPNIGGSYGAMGVITDFEFGGYGRIVTTRGAGSAAAAGIGYATGAGNAATQATSKATTVAVTTLCGQITTHAAELAAGDSAVFAVSLSGLASTDVVIANICEPPTLNAYTVSVVRVAAGSFRLRLSNVSGGNLSEAVLINYAVIRSVAA